MRTFIAIDLPEAILAALGQQQAAFRAACSTCRKEEVRWTRPEGIHLTLKFLGEISEERLREVTEVLRTLEAFENFSVEVKGFGFFPDARRPRVFWAGLEAPPALPQLAERVEAAMEKLGFAREARPFTPHLTLARFKVPRPQPTLQARIEQEFDRTLGRFDVSEFFLFESKFSGGGAPAVYRKIARFPR